MPSSIHSFDNLQYNLNISYLFWALGSGISNSKSNRPGLRNALSIAPKRLVAPITKILLFLSFIPSIKVNSVVTYLTSYPSLVSDLSIAIASNSSIKITALPVISASSKTLRSSFSPTLTYFDISSAPSI